MSGLIRQLIFGVLLGTALTIGASTFEGLSYKSGCASIIKLGEDIFHFLSDEQRNAIGPQPIGFDTANAPSVRLFALRDNDKTARGVWISEGFVQLINRIAHAEAIDKIERGYFARYMRTLENLEDGSIPPLPDGSNPAYWTEDVLNEQLSNFNSIVGMIMGIKLAHHCLGHYEKYKRGLAESSAAQDPIPITALLTAREWDTAFCAGVQIALNAGCTIEGAIPFFEAINKLKKRPAWVACVLPECAEFARMKREMKRIQNKFFYDS